MRRTGVRPSYVGASRVNVKVLFAGRLPRIRDISVSIGGWQWVASSADAAPYFRIFNPVLQGERFDPDGVYVKRWVPELSGLPSSLVHRPWAATPAQLAAAGVRLGETYPNRIIEHDEARRRALAALKRPSAS